MDIVKLHELVHSMCHAHIDLVIIGENNGKTWIIFENEIIRENNNYLIIITQIKLLLYLARWQL